MKLRYVIALQVLTLVAGVWINVAQPWKRPVVPVPITKDEPMNEVVAWVYGFVGATCDIRHTKEMCQIKAHIEDRLPKFTEQWRRP